MRRLLFLMALVAIALCSITEQASAQYFGGYGAGSPSPQALYSGPNNANSGVLYPNGFVQGYGYAAPPPMYNYGGYGGMGYGGYGYQRMPLGQAIATAAVITAINNRGYGGGYGYQSYNARGFRGGYGGGFHHHHHHH